MQTVRDRQLKVQPKVGDRLKVNETYAGDSITVGGERWDISREEWEALKRVAGDAQPQSYVDTITKGLTGEAARRALRRAVKRDVPKGQQRIMTRGSIG